MQGVSVERTYEILKENFGYDKFRFDQEKIIRCLLSGKDVLALMPTGGGKSLCYQLPALCLEGLALVVSPLISLMRDQVVALEQNGIAASFWNSTLDFSEKRAIEKKLHEKKLKLLYVAPEGIVSGTVLSLLRDQTLSLIAIDEAHCVSQWGHEFRPDYQSLHYLKQHFPQTPTIALTATADPQTRLDICKELALKNPEFFVSSFDRPNIKYEILERTHEMQQLHAFLQSNHRGDTGIVYCLSRKKVDKTVSDLKKLGYIAVPYHAGLSSRERARNQRRFDNEDNLIVVATIAFGMGIDRPDVRFVAHLDLPKSIEAYYQETGRAGRDGLPANAWMVYGLADVIKLSRMLELTEANETYKKFARQKLDKMLALCESIQCRRKLLLEYFGEKQKDSCGNCDACLHPPKQWDATIEAQKLLSAVYRTGQVFGAGHVIDVLRGSHNEKILARKHNELSVYGIGKDYSKGEWNNILRQLLNLGYLFVKDWDFKSLALTAESREVLSGKVKVVLRKLRQIPHSAHSKKSSQREVVHGQRDLFEALKALRLRLARELKVPPYLVFSDKSLQDMCHLLPRNETEFLMVHGVGQSKLSKFGKVFIQAISEFQ